MIVIKESNKERQEFVKNICTELRKTCAIIGNEINIVNGENVAVEMSYEDWVSNHFASNLCVVHEGYLMVESGCCYVLLKEKNGLVWYSKDTITTESTVSNSERTKNVTAVYGLSSGKYGYFSTSGRTLLYCEEWKKVEVTMDEIAKKFGIPVERLRIKQ
jgi:hypothetical protein